MTTQLSWPSIKKQIEIAATRHHPPLSLPEKAEAPTKREGPCLQKGTKKATSVLRDCDFVVAPTGFEPV